MEDLFVNLCSYDNLKKAFMKARKGKTSKLCVIKFQKELKKNLFDLRNELIFHTYKPKPLEIFIIRDPKTRKISKSYFRDRVVHHALVNIIEPIFDKTFIYDNFANRIGKGALNAIERFDKFKRKVSKNNSRNCFVLKADVRHYFETVDHNILLNIIKNKIKDQRVLWLIDLIINNYKTKENGKGMPLGNLTSQFLANVYLNELDQFVKHNLKAKYYIRYVDDFVILHYNKKVLEKYKAEIDNFLRKNLELELHPDKSSILTLKGGIGFLGFRIFFHHKLIKKKNLNNFDRKFRKLRKLYKEGLIDREKIIEKLEGWLSYVSHANTFKYRMYLTKLFDYHFNSLSQNLVSNPEKYKNYIKKVKSSNIQFSVHKTLYLFKKGLNAREISEVRKIKESTVLEHFSKLIEYNQMSVFDILSKDKISKISQKIKGKNDRLKEIKQRLNDDNITYDEINCVLAMIKLRNKMQKYKF